MLLAALIPMFLLRLVLGCRALDAQGVKRHRPSTSDAGRSISARMIDLTKTFYIIFGLLSIAGGVMGYLKAASPASLIAGGISGILLIVAGVLLRDKTTAGLILGGVISLALLGRFLPIFLAKQTWMPAGMMAILGGIGVILTVLAFVKR
jgi:uncharacterized membrane protein (UPF0136 family)